MSAWLTRLIFRLNTELAPRMLPAKLADGAEGSKSWVSLTLLMTARLLP